MPIPIGIYNELRDAGTILEFYRPPVGIYFEGAFSAEAVDGAVVSHEFFAQKPWSLKSEFYSGEWERAEVSAPDVFDGRAEDAYGAQFWLNTPVSGLRLGFAAQRFNQTGGLPIIRASPRDRFDTYLFSVDADLPRFVLRMEAQLIKTSFSFVPRAEFPAYYVLAGLHANDHLDLYLMHEDSQSKLSGGLFPPVEVVFFEDWAAGIAYRFNPGLVLRLEAHRFRTTSADIPVPFGSPPVRSDFGILSLSMSF